MENYENYMNSMENNNERPAAARKIKKHGFRKFLAAVLICAIVGGASGFAVSSIMLRSQATASAGTGLKSASEVKADTLSLADGTLTVTANPSTAAMTPQSVYASYANAVVAIANEGTTTNIFGQITPMASSGSGFILTEDGYIMTNYHVIADANTITVTTTDGTKYPAEIIGGDKDNDVALLKIDAAGLPTVSIGNSDNIEVGEQVAAIGNPLGELTNTLTVGYVSALDREISENGTPINMFQTDCAINSGNSGGPIFDMNGNVVGITTAKYSTSVTSGNASVEGIGFCIPINDAMSIAQDLLMYGYVKGRPSIGISTAILSSAVTQYYGLPEGIYIQAVAEGSAADKAGLAEGDMITAFDGTPVASTTQLKALLKQHSAGDEVVLTIYHSKTQKTEDVALVLDEKTGTAAQQNNKEDSAASDGHHGQSGQPQLPFPGGSGDNDSEDSEEEIPWGTLDDWGKWLQDIFDGFGYGSNSGEASSDNT